jgi:DNA modification methylase
VEDVATLMNGEKADLLLTDPPYGIKADKGFSGAGGFAGKGKPIPRRQYKDDWDSCTPPQKCFENALGFADNAIIWGGNFFTDKLPLGKHWLVWNKHNTMPTFSDAELAWTNFNRNSVKLYDVEYNGLIGREKERFHPTRKPIKLIKPILLDYSADNALILDLFGGSGSTLIACEQTNRQCRMMELDEHYCDVIRKRWAEYVHGEGCDWQSLTPEVVD